MFRADEIDVFSPEWINPEEFRHNRDWNRYREGKADELGRRSLEEVGGYSGGGSPRSKVRRAGERKFAVVAKKIPPGRIGRFQVMALLQAVRYYLLTGDLERVKSFDLNRAIFCARTKRRGSRECENGQSFTEGFCSREWI